MKATKIFLAAMLFLLTLAGKCFATPVLKSQSSITIRGSAVDIPEGKSVKLYVYPLVFTYRTHLDATLYETSCTKEDFKIKVAGISKPTYISVYIPKASGDNYIMQYYLVEPGDNIQLKINDTEWLFTGTGSEKYNCQYRINKLTASVFKYPGGKDSSINGQLNLMVANAQNVDWLYKLKLHTLEEYKYGLSQAIYRQLWVDYAAEKYLVQYGELHTLLGMLKNGSYKSAAIAFYNNYLKALSINIPFPANHYSSRSYTGMLAAKAKLDIRLKVNNYTAFDSVPGAEQLFKYYQSNYNGNIYKKLLVHYIVDQAKHASSMAGLIDYVLPQQTDTRLISLLNAINSERLQNVPAKSFSWVDTSGKKYTLADFIGKNLVINFWMYGCSFCTGMEKQMKKVRQQFEGNDKVVFLSVCVVADKTRWIKGLHTGEYSGVGSIELFTNGKGMEDPFTKFYGYSGVPSLMLINSKGIVVDTRPTRPYPGPSTERFIQQIQRML